MPLLRAPGDRHLLLCFDAFGTLFQPTWPIAAQYHDVALQCGLGDTPSPDIISANFKAAYKHQAETLPNFGLHDGLTPRQWWEGVIRQTFAPAQLPDALVPSLLERFASRKGYRLRQNLHADLKRLKRHNYRYKSVVVGVITNSDHRVPQILSSFGLQISPLRANGHAGLTGRSPMARKAWDVDFHCLSYDVGVEKPGPRIFDTAVQLARDVHLSRGNPGFSLIKWDKIYVGDDWKKDVLGARGAGWKGVWWPWEGQEDILPAGARYRELEDYRDQSVHDFMQEEDAVRVRRLSTLVEYLRRKFVPPPRSVPGGMSAVRFLHSKREPKTESRSKPESRP